MPLSWDHAAALQRVDGDAELLAELVEIFLDDYPRHLAALQRSLAQKDYAALHKAAHTLKGSLGYLGAGEGEQLAAAIEQAGQRPDEAKLQALNAELAAYVEALREAMLSSLGEGERAGRGR